VSVRRASALVAAALLLAGCASDTGPKPAELQPIANPRPVNVVWVSRVGLAEGGYVFSPARVGDALYAAARDGTVMRLDAATGEERWRILAGHTLSAGVGADGKLVVVATEKGEVLALDATSGQARWHAQVSSEVLAAPALGADLVLVRSADNRVYAFGAADGKREWVYPRSPASLVVRSPAGITIRGDTAYIGFPGGKLVALALANGTARWEATVAAPRGATELERVTDIVGDPAVSGREVCAAAFQGRVACYDAQTGNQTWGRDISSLTGVSLDAGYAYVTDERGAVHAFDRSSGRSIWRQDRLANRGVSLPLPVGNEVVVADFEGYVHFLARDTGAFVARGETDGYAVETAPIALASGLVVQTQYGGLYAYAPPGK
jgi:outer membrane protein assembly factor BamB